MIEHVVPLRNRQSPWRRPPNASAPYALQARIYWDLEHYPMVEKIFRQSAEFCSEHEVWVLNVAHVFFLQVTAV